MIRRLAVMMMVVAVFATPTFAAQWNPVDDWSLTGNPNGVWTYGYTSSLDSGYTISLMTDNADYAGSGMPGLQEWNIGDAVAEDGYAPQIVCNVGTTSYASNIFPAHSLRMHPGPLANQVSPDLNNPGNTSICILRWTAPSAGQYQVAGKFYATPHDPTTDVYALANGVVFSSGAIYQNEIAFNQVFNLEAGGVLDFAVGPGQTYYCDTTGLDLDITTVPEPSSILALMCGVTGFGGMLIRRKRA